MNGSSFAIRIFMEALSDFYFGCEIADYFTVPFLIGTIWSLLLISEWLSIALIFIIDCSIYLSFIFLIISDLILNFEQMSILNVVPVPTSLSTLISHPIWSMIFLQILKPRPVPYGFMLSCSCSFPKSMNRFFRFSGEIPTPASSTSRENLAY